MERLKKKLENYNIIKDKQKEYKSIEINEKIHIQEKDRKINERYKN